MLYHLCIAKIKTKSCTQRYGITIFIFLMMKLFSEIDLEGSAYGLSIEETSLEKK